MLEDRVYAVYKGDNLLMFGRLEEIHKETGKSINTLKWYQSPSATKRQEKRKNGFMLIDLEEDYE